MIFVVPYVYTAEVVRGRRQKPERAVYYSETAVEVREVSQTDAPIAVRYATGVKTKNRDEIVELRWCFDSLYRPYILDHPRKDRRPWDRNRLNTTLETGLANPLCTSNYSNYMCRHQDPDIRVFVKSDEERIVDNIRENASKLLLVDGMVWKKTSEPLMVYQQENSKRWVDIGEYDIEENADNTFRLDEAYLIDEVTSRGLKPGDLGHVTVEIPFHEVLIPECLRAVATERDLLEGAFTLYEAMKNRLEYGSEAHFSAFARLRDALASYRADDDDERRVENDMNDDELLETLPNIMARALAAYVDHGNRLNMLEDYTAARVRAALRRVEIVLSTRNEPMLYM